MNSAEAYSLTDRLARLDPITSEVTAIESDELCNAAVRLQSKPWIAIVSSRLGHNPVLHRDVCRLLTQSMIDCRRRDAIALLAYGSAIYPWAIRAAELFDVPVVELVVGKDEGTKSLPRIWLTSKSNENLSRDWAAMFLADRVDALYVRRKGTIAAAAKQRVERFRDATTRVAVTSLPDCAAKTLIQAGAVGWLANQDDVLAQSGSPPLMEQPTTTQTTVANPAHWTTTEGEWLVHCTRACAGPWPGQTDAQYRDELLLGQSPSQRTPLDTLLRILRSRRLLANAVASARAFPVVCFSSVALSELLVSRSYRPHLKRWDYEPWGIAIRRSAAIDLGVQEVIYGESEIRKTLPACDQFRFQAAGKTYDWTAEREWRSPVDVDLNLLAKDDVRVFVACEKDAKTAKKQCPWPISVVWHTRPKAVESL